MEVTKKMKTILDAKLIERTISIGYTPYEGLIVDEQTASKSTNKVSEMHLLLMKAIPCFHNALLQFTARESTPPGWVGHTCDLM